MLLDRFVRVLFPRQDQFFGLLEHLAAHIREAAAVFGELHTSESRSQVEAVAARLKPIETAADETCGRLYAEVDKTFVTPIDREDLAALAKALDDVVDSMEHTAAFAVLYRFDRLTEPMRELVRVTAAAAVEVAGAVGHLRRMDDPDAVRGPTLAVHALENEADAVYRGAISALFSDGTLSPIELVRRKDMLFGLEAGVDQCQDAMDVIRSVVVKNG